MLDATRDKHDVVGGKTFDLTVEEYFANALQHINFVFVVVSVVHGMPAHAEREASHVKVWRAVVGADEHLDGRVYRAVVRDFFGGNRIRQNYFRFGTLVSMLRRRGFRAKTTVSCHDFHLKRYRRRAMFFAQTESSPYVYVATHYCRAKLLTHCEILCCTRAEIRTSNEKHLLNSVKIVINTVRIVMHRESFIMRCGHLCHTRGCVGVSGVLKIISGAMPITSCASLC